MKNTTRLSEDLFNLFVDLSKIEGKDRLVNVFTNRMGEIFSPAKFFYQEKADDTVYGIELKTGSQHQGSLIVKDAFSLTPTASSYVQKAARLFAVQLGSAELSQSNSKIAPKVNVNKANGGGESLNSISISDREKEGNESIVDSKSGVCNEKIVDSNACFFDLFETMTQGVVFQDPDGEITSINPSALKILGLEKDFVLGTKKYDKDWRVVDKFMNPVAWEDIPAMVAIREKRAVKQQILGIFSPYSNDFLWILVDSIPLFSEDDSSPCQVYTCFVDYNEQKKNEDQLLLLSHSVEQSPVSVVITDYDGKIEYVNPTFSKVTGYSFDEVRGQNPRIMKSGETPIELYEDLWETILSGKKWSGEVINKKKDGRFYWEQLFVSPLLQEDGKISHFVAIREDISEKKAMIENLVKAKERAEESDRLKTAFLANISHEIRTPMNGILGFLELLKNPELENEVKSQYIDVVNRSGDRLMSTINDLIEISKIEAGQVKTEISTVYIPEIMDYYLNFFKPEAREKHLGIKIVRQIEDPEALIKTDRSKIEATLSNLISNAIKFTQIGEIEFGNYIKGEFLVFFVKDTGVGISPDRMDAVFDRFVQADLNMTRPYQGTGLGLSIVKGYIEMLKGKIWVESREGEGSIFYFTIPYNPVKP